MSSGMSKIKQKLLPLIWFTASIFGFFLAIRLSKWVLGILLGEIGPVSIILSSCFSWAIGVVAGLAAGSLAVGFDPDLVYSTDTKVDGLGYVHDATGVVLYLALIALVSAISSIVRLPK